MAHRPIRNILGTSKILKFPWNLDLRVDKAAAVKRGTIFWGEAA
jgi:hypothetical protein